MADSVGEILETKFHIDTENMIKTLNKSSGLTSLFKKKKDGDLTFVEQQQKAGILPSDTQITEVGEMYKNVTNAYYAEKGDAALTMPAEQVKKELNERYREALRKMNEPDDRKKENPDDYKYKFKEQHIDILFSHSDHHVIEQHGKYVEQQKAAKEAMEKAKKQAVPDKSPSASLPMEQVETLAHRVPAQVTGASAGIAIASVRSFG